MAFGDERSRFFSKVEKTGECWEWKGARAPKGYGAFWMNGKVHRAHRAAWLLERGDPGELHVLHRCDNPMCVRVEHLFLGTNAENHADKVLKGRQVRGQSHRGAKLTASHVRRIRAEHDAGVSYRALGRRYGVSTSTAFDAVNGIQWRHVQ